MSLTMLLMYFMPRVKQMFATYRGFTQPWLLFAARATLGTCFLHRVYRLPVPNLHRSFDTRRGMQSTQCPPTWHSLTFRGIHSSLGRPEGRVNFRKKNCLPRWRLEPLVPDQTGVLAAGLSWLPKQDWIMSLLTIVMSYDWPNGWSTRLIHRGTWGLSSLGSAFLSIRDKMIKILACTLRGDRCGKTA